jgi:hypothetical protein
LRDVGVYFLGEPLLAELMPVRSQTWIAVKIGRIADALFLAFRNGRTGDVRNGPEGNRLVRLPNAILPGLFRSKQFTSSSESRSIPVPIAATGRTQHSGIPH